MIGRRGLLRLFGAAPAALAVAPLAKLAPVAPGAVAPGGYPFVTTGYLQADNGQWQPFRHVGGQPSARDVSEWAREQIKVAVERQRQETEERMARGERSDGLPWYPDGWGYIT